jgi:hypothetical protein
MARAQTYTYKGGDIVANPQVVAVLWGMQDAGLQARLDNFYARLVASTYFDPLGEYSTPRQRLGKASYRGSLAIRAQDTGVTVDTVAVARQIDASILGGELPFPTDDIIYAVHLGAGMSATMGSNIFGIPLGAATGAGFCAYHFSARTSVPTPIPLLSAFGPRIRIAVLPDPTSAPGTSCTGGMAKFDAITAAATHEIVEAITNPDSVEIEMQPLIGANVQCDGVRIPVGALAPVVTSPLTANGLVRWAWTSQLSGPCNPDEVADTCTAAATYDTTGRAGGKFVVSRYFLRSTRACAIASDVIARPPVQTPSPNPACVAACNDRFSVCMETAAGQRPEARCRAQALSCKARC